MAAALEDTRVSIPDDFIVWQGKADSVFDMLKSSNGLTEEYLYTHQPVTTDVVAVFSTSPLPIGFLDRGLAKDEGFTVLEGPAVVVARKGYAGRMFVVEDECFIVHEDAYAVKPKSNFSDMVDLNWFAGHYSREFQLSRTSTQGIGDFPRTKFKSMHVALPKPEFQEQVRGLYRRRDAILETMANMSSIAAEKVGELF